MSRLSKAIVVMTVVLVLLLLARGIVEAIEGIVGVFS